MDSFDLRHLPTKVLSLTLLSHKDYWPVPEKVFNAMPFLHGVDMPLVFVGIMTFILILSSVTMVLAVEAGHQMNKAAVEKWMMWTIVGGIAFLSCQAWEWSHFIAGTEEGLLLPDGTHIFGASLTQNEYGPSNFAAFFFFITGFHGFHVFTGILLNFIIFYQVVTGLYQRIGNYDMVEKSRPLLALCRPSLGLCIYFLLSSVMQRIPFFSTARDTSLCFRRAISSNFSD